MNVSKNGYYTTEYIDHRRYGTPRSPGSTTSNVRDPVNTKTLRFDLPSLTSTEADDLPEDMTPAQLTYLHKEKPRTVTYDNYYRSSRKQSLDDDISQEISLANTEEFYLNEKKPLKKQAILGYSGYYIDQKKRYDEAEFVKPRMYTHKTFKDVFKSEDEERLNPIDLVFEDPQEVREQEEKKKFTRAMRNVQRKMGLPDYESYDYYLQQQAEADRRAAAAVKRKKAEQKKAEKLEKKERKLEKKKKKKGAKATPEAQEGSDEHVPEQVKEVFTDAEDLDYEAPEPGNMRKNLRQKFRIAKKQLENNYFDNYAKELEERENAKNNTLACEAAENAQKQAELLQEQQLSLYVGPQNNFSPAWNYLLSFLVYDLPRENIETAVQGQRNDVSPKEAKKIVEITEPKASESRAVVVKNKAPKWNKPKMKLNLKPAKSVLTNWNQPASAYFAGNRGPMRGETVQYNQMDDVQDLAQYDQGIFPEEHMVYYDDDDVVDDELVYDPKTDTFLPMRSMGGNQTMDGFGGALFDNASRYSTSGSTDQLHHGAPLRIILNINLLIKQIKIMKIIFAPIDVISEFFPNAQVIVVLVELVIFMWMLYELSLLIDALCMAVKAVCAPMIAVGRFMNRIV